MGYYALARERNAGNAPWETESGNTVQIMASQNFPRFANKSERFW